MKRTIKDFAFTVKGLGIVLAIILLPMICHAQWINNLRQKYIPVKSDTVEFDTLSIIPHTLYLMTNDGKVLDSSAYNIPSEKPVIIWNKTNIAYQSLADDSLKMVYRVFPYLFSKSYQHKDVHRIQKDIYGNVDPFVYSGSNGTADLFQFQGLNKSGSISRGVTFGNNQDLVVNSNLNLQLGGKIGDNIEILASITDQNIPIQPEGNTQQIQDFDKVFIQLSKEKSKLVAGDFELKRPNSYFMNLYKKGQGGIFTTEFNVEDTAANKKPGIMRVGVSGAISKGKYARNTIQGQEGNQGPYKLKGNNSELYIIILSGSEKVYIDGILLQRGQDNDYTIDYNTAELTFMPKRLITKDSRLVVEFQYSNNFYARSMLFLNSEYESEKLKLRFNAFSEQDAKSQPIQQSLSNAQQQFLSGIGNDIQNAVWPAIDTIAFDSTQILYKQMDTIVGVFLYPKIFVYSTSKDSAKYRLAFSNVGQGHGDYVPVSSTANGKVYRWVEPINNIRQGSYEPVELLVTPKKQQLFTFGGDYRFNKNTAMNFETALSNNDVNLFAGNGKQDNVGEAFKVGFENIKPLDKDSAGWKLKSAIKFEKSTKNFQPIERYRPVEFERDWNIKANDSVKADDHLGGVSFGLMHPKYGTVSYDFKTYMKAAEYKDVMNGLSSNLNWHKFRLISNISLLNSSGTVNPSVFLRQKVDLSKTIKSIMVGVSEEEENNKFKSLTSDNLLTSSYRFNQWMVYVTNPDSTKNKYRIDYGERYDFGVWGLSFKQATKAKNANFSLELIRNPESRLSFSATYRVLTVLDSTLTNQTPTNSLLNRLEYNFSALKRLITSSTFYEIGTGQEQKQQYSYIQVQPGKGVYQYLGDLNHNGVQDLNEFQIADFPDQAMYIRIYTPTNEYIKDYTNRFNESMFINPAAALGNQVVGFKKFISRFSDNVMYSTDRKTTNNNLNTLFNPFTNNVGDSALISTNVSARNSIYFNKTNAKWGIDYTISDVRNKSLLANGFDSRVATENALSSRWNISRIIGLNLALKQGNKRSLSDFFSANDYNYNYQQIDPKISYQSGVSFRTSLTYSYSEKRNNPSLGGERVIGNNLGLEMKYSSPAKGVVTMKFNYIKLDYSAPENTQIAFQMLDGLHNGTNLTWGINLQRTISGNLQLSINYDGRKSETTNAINTGNVQLRAYF